MNLKISNKMKGLIVMIISITTLLALLILTFTPKDLNFMLIAKIYFYILLFISIIAFSIVGIRRGLTLINPKWND